MAKELVVNGKEQIKVAYRTVRRRVKRRAVQFGLRKDSVLTDAGAVEIGAAPVL